ncbi:MAG: SpoIIE family protein phosphatase [Phycisphaeraceae bacterium]|nr:SpoIIE family protein phosphatase [Phycisphaeraceae bacterium]
MGHSTVEGHSVGRPGRPRGGLSLTWQLIALAVLTAIAATSLVAWLGFRAEMESVHREVDARLRAIASAVPDVLPADYSGRVLRGEVTEAQYDALVTKLTRLAREAEVWYLYACEHRDGQILMLASSATEKELLAHDWARLLEPYEQPPAAITHALETGQPRFASYTDKYGSFRSVFVPAGDAVGRYVVGADVRLDDLHEVASANLRWYAMAGLGVAAVVGLVGVVAGRRIARPIATLSRDVKTFTDGDFSNDDESLASLGRLASRGGRETRDLAGTFLEMRNQLVRHIDDLTRVTAEKERITSQLEIARDIQRGLLPSAPPPADGFDIAGWSEAAEQAGGDFYDWSMTSEGRVIVTVADVTGHGIGPAIMAAVCRAYARASLHGRRPLVEIIDRMNRLVCADTHGRQFVTFFAGILDPGLSTMTILSAGHGPLLLYRAATREIEQPATHGLPLGIVEDAEHDPGTDLRFDPGDILLVVSDGFFEWMSTQGEQFGVERLTASFLAAAALPSEQIIERIRADVEAFTAGTQQPDDMTAVAIRCTGAASR